MRQIRTNSQRDFSNNKTNEYKEGQAMRLSLYTCYKVRQNAQIFPAVISLN